MKLRTFAANGATTIALILVGLVTGILSARALGVEDRGNLAIIFFWGQFLSAIAGVSLSDAVVVHAGQARASLNSIVTRANWLSFIIVLIATPLGALAIFLALQDRAEIIFWWTLAFWLPQLLLRCVEQPLLGALRVEGRFDTLNVLRFTLPLTYMAGALAAWIFQLGLGGFVIAHIAALLIGTAARYALLRRYLRPRSQSIPAQELGSSALRIHSVTIVSAVASQLDRLAIIQFGAAAEIGLYMVALTMATPIHGILLNSIKTIALPKLVTLSGAERLVAIGDGVQITWWGSMAATLGMCLAAPILVPFLFGAEFSEAGAITSYLALAMTPAPVRSFLIEACKSLGANRTAFLSEVTYSVALVCALIVCTALGLNWPIIWALAAANIAALIFLASSPAVVSARLFVAPNLRGVAIARHAATALLTRIGQIRDPRPSQSDDQPSP